MCERRMFMEEKKTHPSKFSKFSIPEKVLESTVSINDKERNEHFL